MVFAIRRSKYFFFNLSSETANLSVVLSSPILLCINLFLERLSSWCQGGRHQNKWWSYGLNMVIVPRLHSANTVKYISSYIYTPAFWQDSLPLKLFMKYPQVSLLVNPVELVSWRILLILLLVRSGEVGLRMGFLCERNQDWGWVRDHMGACDRTLKSNISFFTTTQFMILFLIYRRKIG